MEINIMSQRQVSSAERHAIYKMTRDKDFIYFEGRSPVSGAVDQGTIITNIPYWKGDHLVFRVVEVLGERPHRGNESLTWWKVKCVPE